MGETENMNSQTSEQSHHSFAWMSELLLSLFLVVGVGVSLTTPHLITSAEEQAMSSHIRMRGGPPRQLIRMGSPEAWLKEVTRTLGNLGISVDVLPMEDNWYVDATIGELSDEDARKLRIFLQRYGVNTEQLDELHITLSRV